MSVDLDLGGVLGADDFPRRAVLHPGIGELHLVAIAEFLFEEAVLIVDAVADGRKIKGGQRIQEAGGETAETAVAQAHVVFLAAEFLVVEAEFLEGVNHVVEHAGGVEAVGKQAAHEEFQREIIDALDVLVVVNRLGGDHPLDDDALHRLGGGQPPIPLRRRWRHPARA